MGIADLWHLADHTEQDLDEIGYNFYKEHGRMPVVAMDMYIVMFELLDGTRATGWANFHKQFMRRLNMFLSAGIIVVGVFDGPNKQHKLRNSAEPKTPFARPLETKLVQQMKLIMQAMGLKALDADGEGETLVAHLQRNKLVDFAFSKDSDILACGATRALRFSKTKAKKRRVEIYEVGRDRQWAFLMYAVLVGHDFGKGAERIGGEQGKNLVAIPALVDAFKVWYEGGDVDELVSLVENELHSKAHGTLKRGWNKSRHLEADVFDRDLVRAWLDCPTPQNKFRWERPSPALLKSFWDKPCAVYSAAEYRKAKEQRKAAREKALEEGKEPVERAERTESEGPVLYSLWLCWLLAHNESPPIGLKTFTRNPQVGKEFALRFEPSESRVQGQPSCAVPDKILVPYHLYEKWEAKKEKPQVEKPKRAAAKAPAHTQKLTFATVSKEVMLANARAQHERAQKVPQCPTEPQVPEAPAESDDLFVVSVRQTPSPPTSPCAVTSAPRTPPQATSPDLTVVSGPIFIDLCDDETDTDEPVLAPVSSLAPIALPPSPEKVLKSPKKATRRASAPRRKRGGAQASASRMQQTLITAWYRGK